MFVFIKKNFGLPSKFDDEKCKIFSSLEELRVELHEHVMAAVNVMIDECNETYCTVKNS